MSVTEVAAAPPSDSSDPKPTDPKLISDKPTKPSKPKLIYDIAMVVLIVIDLSLITLDNIFMSATFSQLIARLSFEANTSAMTLVGWLMYYREHIHEPLRGAGGIFTVFLVSELLLRWALAIKNKRYYRWFFFPFAHWYEVLGCLPQLRALRLLRAVIIGHRLYQLGYQVLPASWLATGKFYFEVVLEELSDRVILTGLSNIRHQFQDTEASKALIAKTIQRNQVEVEAALVALLKQVIEPHITAKPGSAAPPAVSQFLATEVGAAVQEGLANTPEINRYLKLIPIAGSLIAGQLSQIGQHVGENVALSLNKRLLESQSLDKVLQEVVHGIVTLDMNNPALDLVVKSLIEDALDGLEAQVKVQQWKNSQYLKV